ncbi:MAG: hypothetical protein ACTJHU_00355 [Mycetocola sp.]
MSDFDPFAAFLAHVSKRPVRLEQERFGAPSDVERPGTRSERAARAFYEWEGRNVMEARNRPDEAQVIRDGALLAEMDEWVAAREATQHRNQKRAPSTVEEQIAAYRRRKHAA